MRSAGARPRLCVASLWRILAERIALPTRSLCRVVLVDTTAVYALCNSYQHASLPLSTSAVRSNTSSFAKRRITNSRKQNCRSYATGRAATVTAGASATRAATTATFATTTTVTAAAAARITATAAAAAAAAASAAAAAAASWPAVVAAVVACCSDTAAQPVFGRDRTVRTRHPSSVPSPPAAQQAAKWAAQQAA
eukprot:2260335-Pleurochrysis_carterae.AAC.4